MNLRIERLTVALHDFDLVVDVEMTAETVGIYGPSGAGKTTLMETVAGLRRPEHGRIVLNGRLLHGDGVSVPPRVRRIGYVPQDETLFPHLSVRANAMYGARDGAGPLRDLAEILDLAPLLDRGIGNLSGGERRRVALARALMTRPDVLVLDEPLSGLDAALKQRTMDLLHDVRSRLRMPMMLVSHDRAELRTFCNDVIVLDRGRVVAHGPAETVL